MNKTIINVPPGITKLSQWQDFENYLPSTGKFVLNKKVTGCGATTYYLENSQPVILCSHRTELLDCKAKSPRHLGRVHLFKAPTDSTKEDLERNLGNLRRYLDSCLSVVNPFTGALEPGMPPKILVTTDSLGHVVNILNEYNLLGYFTLVSDECQCIFTDASFKGSSVLGYLRHLDYINSVVFLSATPYLENYLDKVDYFCNLPYIELEWPSDIVSEVYLTPYYVKSLSKALKDKIKFWRNTGYFEESGCGRATEAVFFVNSVSAILTAVKSLNLTDNEVNIVCSRSNKSTVAKVKKAGFEVGTVPVEGEPHKPITFVTKCAFEGVDFYNPNAYTYIFSNPNLNNLALDLSIDLVQILGRQRLDSNPWRNYATIYFGCTKDKFKITEEEFAKNVNEKEEFTQEAIYKINTTSGHIKEKWIKTFESSHAVDFYSRDYVDVCTDSVTGKVIAFSNNLVKVAETRAWDIRNNIYNDKYQILRSIQNLGYRTNSQTICDLNQFFLDNNEFCTRMKEYCRVMSSADKTVQSEIVGLVIIPGKFHEYYYLLGPEKIRALSFEESKIVHEVDYRKSHGNLRVLILQEFGGKEKISKSEAKIRIQRIYNEAGLKRTAKATDLREYFDTSECKVSDDSGKLVNGIRLLSIK